MGTWWLCEWRESATRARVGVRLVCGGAQSDDWVSRNSIRLWNTSYEVLLPMDIFPSSAIVVRIGNELYLSIEPPT